MLLFAIANQDRWTTDNGSLGWMDRNLSAHGTLRCDVTCVSAFPREKMAMYRLNFVLALDRDFWGLTRGKIRPTEEESAGKEADGLQLKAEVDTYSLLQDHPQLLCFSSSATFPKSNSLQP